MCRHLYQAGKTFIVIDVDPERIDEAIQQDYLAAVGDASEDDILIKAGIKQAKTLMSAISNDTANVYLVLSARNLNENLEIIARSSGESSTKKLERAGADQIVSPFEMGARRMAAHIIQPEIIEFEDMFSVEKEYGLQVQKLKVQKSSQLIDKRLNESSLKAKTKGGLVIGIERDGNMLINPPGYTVIKSGDIFLAIGNDEQLELMRKILK
ncbi:MAG: TrkA family potassium uptake protein [candidate division KSB1 bacterium]|nr:TrkA family potassium uptake protein [candidate division KSB1 bacterium]